MGSNENYVKFNNINVNMLDSTSGIFVGNNIANGWRTSTRNNEGFGNIGGCTVSKVLSIVFDNDGVDTVINDIQNGTNEVSFPSISSVPTNQTLNFQNLNVNAVHSNSAISIGENKLDQWRSHHKENMGFGNGTGFNIFSRNANLIDDEDIIDTPIKDTKTFKNAADNISP